MEDAGYQVTVAGDGVEGITCFHGSVKFDLILLDIMLPKIDGYGVCEVIRKEGEHYQTIFHEDLNEKD